MKILSRGPLGSLFSLLAMVSLSLSVSTIAHASESSAPASETKVTLDEIVGEGERTETDKADELITNRMLRASAGSLSTWSVSTTWGYLGSSVKNPFDPVRPNIRGAAGTADMHRATGDIALRRRLSAVDSLSLGAGLGMFAPFHGSVDFDSYDMPEDTLNRLRDNHAENAQKLSVNDPYLSYTRLARLGNVQSVSSATLYAFTNSYTRGTLGGVASLSLGQTFMTDTPVTGLSFGVSFSAGSSLYSKDDTDLLGSQTRYSLGVFPVAEYVINDTFNLRTLIGQIYQQTRAEQDPWRFKNQKMYQSVGLGISVTRDIYLYPNVQFIPREISADQTNVGISATINL